MSRQKNRAVRTAGQGFTLIELLLVLVILAILTAVVATKFVGRSEDAKKTAAGTDIKSMELAFDAYEVDNGHLPSTDEGLGALVNAPSSAKNWKGPYIKEVRPDPWKNPYVYRFPGSVNHGSYDLFSTGPDSREGTEDDIGNFTNTAH